MAPVGIVADKKRIVPGLSLTSVNGCGTAPIYSLEPNMFIELTWVVACEKKSENWMDNSEL